MLARSHARYTAATRLTCIEGNHTVSLSRNLEKACWFRFRDESFFVEQDFILCDCCATVLAGDEREVPALRPHEQPDHPRHDEGEEDLKRITWSTSTASLNPS